jgi:hypothetical protein
MKDRSAAPRGEQHLLTTATDPRDIRRVYFSVMVGLTETKSWLENGKF